MRKISVESVSGAIAVSVSLFLGGGLVLGSIERTECTLARQIGCDPAALAVAGFTPAHAEGLLMRLGDGDEAVAALNAAEAVANTLVADITELQRQWEGDYLDETAAAIATAEASLETARQDVVEKRAAVIDVALLGAPEGARERLEGVWRSRGVRCPLAVLACTNGADLPLIASLFSKSERNVPGEMAVAESSALSELLSRSDVVDAQHDLDTNQTAIAEVFANWSP